MTPPDPLLFHSAARQRQFADQLDLTGDDVPAAAIVEVSRVVPAEIA